MGSPHRWAAVICAWANGADVQRRVQYAGGQWSPWFSLPKNAQFLEDLTHEYRVSPDNVHPNQRYREAYLAGEKVEFRQKAPENHPCVWSTVDSWLVADCVKRQSPPMPIWDRTWLEFRLAN